MTIRRPKGQSKDTAEPRKQKERAVYIVQSVKDDKEEKKKAEEKAKALVVASSKTRHAGRGLLIAAIVFLAFAVVAGLVVWRFWGFVVALPAVVCFVLYRRARRPKETAPQAEEVKLTTDGTGSPVTTDENDDGAKTDQEEEQESGEDIGMTFPLLNLKPLVPTRSLSLRFILWTLFFKRKYLNSDGDQLPMRPGARNFIRQLDTIICANAIKIESMILVFVNEKGGSAKSVIAAMLVTAYVFITQLAALLVDTNQAKGSSAGRVGAKDSMSIYEAMGLYFNDELRNHVHRRVLYGHHPVPGHGSLRVLRSVKTLERKQFRINRDLGDDQQVYTTDEHVEFLEAEAEVNSLVAADNGNSLDANVCKAAVMVGTGICFTAYATSSDSVEDCHDTIIFYKLTRPHLVRLRGFAVVSGVANYRDADVRKSYAEYFGLPPERVLLFEHDPFLYVDPRQKLSPEEIQQKQKPYELARITLPNQVAIREVIRFAQELHLANDYDPCMDEESAQDDASSESEKTDNQSVSNDQADPPSLDEATPPIDPPTTDEAAPPVDTTNGAEAALQPIGG